MKALALACAALLGAGCSTMGGASGTEVQLILDKTPSWGGCAATVRGAVEKLPGVSGCDVQPGRAEITVSYDPARTSVQQVLDGLQAAGQPAKAK